MIESVRVLQRAARALLRSPGMAAVAVATLALGVGANTALFSVVHAVLIRQLPYEDPGRLVEVAHVDLETGESMVVSPGNFYDWAREVSSFSALAAYDWEAATLVEEGGARRVRGLRTAGSIFDVLGVAAAYGRSYDASADTPEGEAVVVVSAGLARQLFGRAADAPGRALTLDGTTYAVIGVMPPGFRFPSAGADYWLPARYGEEFRGNRTELYMRSIGRLAPGASLAGARAELETIMQRLRADHPKANGRLSATAVPLKDELVSDVRALLLILMGAVGIVLLVACLNLANLLLARFSSRRRELAIRKAMGAGRARIAVEVLAEGVVLAAAGGLVGLWLGTVLLDVLVALFPLDLPRSEEIGISGAVVLFTALTATAAALLATVLPAFRAADEAPATRLGERAETGAGWTRRGLVVIEALLAVVLLSGAVLLTRSVARLQSEDPGFRTDGLVAVDVNVPGTYELERRVAFFRSLEERIEALAGVEDASYTTVLPTAGGGSAAWFNLLDRPAPDGEPPFADYRVVGPDFTAVMGIRLVRGRLPRPEVSRSGPAEVLVDEVLAARFWPDADPVGREVTLGPDGGWIPPSRIVGIVAAVKGASLGGDPPGYVYVPHALTPWWTGMTVVARSSGPRPLSLVDAIRRETAALDPAVPVLDPGTVADRVRESIATERSIATLLGLTAVLALALAAVGLFGLLSYAVARRTRELGIRVALGATPGRVRRDVLGQGVGLAVLGVVPGVALSLLGARLLERWLFGVPATDPVSYLLAALTLVAVAGLASWAPAARATRVEPARSLRED